eukprot:3816033-Lingulodinium_polyedra.AAC.1
MPRLAVANGRGAKRGGGGRVQRGSFCASGVVDCLVFLVRSGCRLGQFAASRGSGGGGGGGE